MRWHLREDDVGFVFEIIGVTISALPIAWTTRQDDRIIRDSNADQLQSNRWQIDLLASWVGCAYDCAFNNLKAAHVRATVHRRERRDHPVSWCDAPVHHIPRHG